MSSSFYQDRFIGRFRNLKKRSQNLVLIDALVVQSQGLRVSRSKGFKSQVVLGSPKMFWEKSRISKKLGSQKR